MTVCVYSFYHIIGEEDTTRFFLSTNYIPQVTHLTRALLSIEPT